MQLCYFGIPSHSKNGGAKANPKNNKMKTVGSDMVLLILSRCQK
jgi:lysyl-tRNA synthetase class II